MRTLRFMIIPFLSVLFLLAACGDPLPIEDMVAARKAIGKALSVKADKYAPEEINAATAKLYESHDLIKSDDMKKASASAVEAERLAREAYDKSSPLAAKDTIDIAEQSLAEAADAGAEEIVASDYAEAESLLDAAQSDYERKEYSDAYVQALEADKKAKEARTVALGKKDILKDSIDEVRITLERSKEYNSDKHAPENVKIAEESLANADDAYADLKLKKGFAAVELAKINADEAYLISLRESAKEELARAKAVIDQADAVKGKREYDELTAAKESYRNAEAMYDEERYKEAIDYAKEAALLSNIVVSASAAQQNAGDDDGDDDAADKNKIGNISVTDDTNDNKDYFLYTVVYRESLKDCLWRIAGKYYKDPHKWKLIYNANKNKIKNPDLIYPGWIIKVPKI